MTLISASSCYGEVARRAAITSPISVSEIEHYSSYPASVKKLVDEASDLSKQNLTYTYGSADPKNKGMDCSGTIYYLLNKLHVVDVPRDASEMYNWATQKGHLHHVIEQRFGSNEFSKLKPGDLLFWTGTCHVKRSNSISHVMVYLGLNAKNQPITFGASNGRTYQGKKMWGVSVFDFHLADGHSKAKFVGYSCIPNFTCSSPI